MLDIDRKDPIALLQWARGCVPYESDCHSAISAYLDNLPPSIGWRPAADQPHGGWLLTRRSDEDGYNITQRISDDEWCDLDGATTVTHSTLLPPTHYLPATEAPLRRLAETRRRDGRLEAARMADEDRRKYMTAGWADAALESLAYRLRSRS